MTVPFFGPPRGDWKESKDNETDPPHYYDLAFDVVSATTLYRRRTPERIAVIEQERALWKLTSAVYRADRACVKCGRSDAGTRYHADADLMIRQCNCGFEWRELPLDAAQ